jgi:[acyl-carrier-protein] S-malonyltransferase
MKLTTTAFVFPGQGSQEVGMGADLCAACPDARDLFAAADRILGFALSDTILDGPEERLRLTENTQPAILLVSVALHRALALQPAAVAGHSLGEYSAAVAAGALDFADAVAIVHKRGRYMQEAVAEGDGAMVAILGVDEDAVRAAIAEQGGVVDVANFNAPGNIVIAGERAATLRVAEVTGGKSRELAVSAPFHSRLMRPAEERLAADLDAAAIADPRVPLYTNVGAAPVTTAAEVRDGLKRQVTRSVRWTDSVRRMAADGVDTFVEIGPGRVLTGLIRRIERDAGRYNVLDWPSVEATRAALAG